MLSFRCPHCQMMNAVNRRALGRGYCCPACQACFRLLSEKGVAGQESRLQDAILDEARGRAWRKRGKQRQQQRDAQDLRREMQNDELANAGYRLLR